MDNDNIIAIVGGLGLLGQSIIAANNGEFKIIWADISSKEDEQEGRVEANTSLADTVDNIFSYSLKHYGVVPKVIINASYPGVLPSGVGPKLENHSIDLIVDLSMQQIQNILEFNLQAFRNYDAHKAGGSILSVGSIYGTMAPDFDIYADTEKDVPLNYAVSKSALNQTIRYLAKRYSKTGIRLNVISFGGIRGAEDDVFRAAYGKKLASGDMLPSEICGKIIIDFCRDMSQFANGQNIIIDEGFSL